MYITRAELAALFCIFVLPVLLVAGVVQFLLLRRVGLRIVPLLGVLVAAAVATLVLMWGLLYVVPHFGRFYLPTVIAGAIVTVVVGLLARRAK